MRRWWSVTIKIFLTAAIFGFVLYTVDLHTLLPALRRLDFQVVPWVMLLALLQTGLLALRWQVISNAVGGAFSFGNAVQGILISYFFSQGLPASVGGDVFRVWWLRRKTSLNMGEASHVVLVDRLAGFFSLLLLSAASVVLLARTTQGVGIATMEAIVGCGIACALVFVLPIPRSLRRLWRKLLNRVPAKLRDFLIWAAELKVLLTRISMEVRLSSLGLSLGVLVHLMTVFIAFLVVRALGHDFAFWQCLAVVPPALLLSYLPISIAGWGTREASMIFGFSLFGLPTADGFLVSIVIGVIILIVSLFGEVLWVSAELHGTFNSMYRRNEEL